MRPLLLHKVAPWLPIPLSAWIKMSSQKLFMPVYHLCSDQAVPHIDHLYKVRSTQQFADDLDILLKHFEPIDLHTVIAVLKGEKSLEKPSFWLSFDDGLREVYEQAMPLLQQKGVPATLFLNNDFLDNQDLFFRFKASLLIEQLTNNPPSPALQSILRERLSGRKLTRELSPESLLQIGYSDRDFLDELGDLLELDFDGYLAERRPYLNEAEVRDWIAKGFTIGAHSLDHPEFRYLSVEEQLRQTRESIRGITTQFQLDYKVFAFPFTDFGVRQAWFDEMLDGELDASFGAAGLKRDTHPRHGQRVPLEGTDDNATAILKAEYLYYALKAPFGKNQISQR